MKNKLFKRVISASLSLMLLAAISSQEITAQYVNPSVEISSERVKIDGKTYISHIVLERQTLYSISKAYEVSIDELYQANPEVKASGLKKNSILLIPVKEEQQPEKKKGSRKNIPEEITANIPLINDLVNDKIQNKGNSSQYTPRIHVVKWGQDLEILSELYGVTVDEIKLANDLKGNKLTRGTKLIIPYKTVEKTVENTVLKSEMEDDRNEIRIPIDSSIFDIARDFFARLHRDKGPVKATLVMPFTESGGKPHQSHMDFYCGLLLGVYDMAKKGVDCNLKVLDMNDKDLPVSKDDITDSDIIIGPVSSEDIQKMANIAKNVQAIISPLDPKGERLANVYPNVIQIPTSSKTQYADMIDWIISEHQPEDKIIVISEKDAPNNNILYTIKAELNNSGVQYQSLSYSVIQGRSVLGTTKSMLTTTGVNRIIIASDREAFLCEATRNLNIHAARKIKMQIYTPSKIRKSTNVDIDYIHNCGLRLNMRNFVNYESEQVMNFILKYRALFKTEPSQFSFQGYDIICYFLDLFSKHGDEWRDYITTTHREMLQNTFIFKVLHSGGHINIGVRRVSYNPDFTIEMIKSESAVESEVESEVEVEMENEEATENAEESNTETTDATAE